MSEKKKYIIRELTHGDRKTVSKMIDKLCEKLGDDSILSMIKVSEGDGGGSGVDYIKKYGKFGIKLIKAMFQVLEKDCEMWFSDLIDVDPKDFNKLPFDIEMRIVKQLKEAPEIGNFFSIASEQFNEIKKYLLTLLKEKEKSGFTTGTHPANLTKQK